MAFLRSRFVLTALVLVASVGIGYALTSGGNRDAGGDEMFGMPLASQDNLDRAMAGLCRAQDRVAEGDLAAARTVFQNDAHLFLHSLASETLKQDREAATNMLLAKYAVEGLLSLPANGSVPAATPEVDEASPEERVANLIEEVRRSSEVIGLQPPGC